MSDGRSRENRESDIPDEAALVSAVLLKFLRKPTLLLMGWNWKMAVVSGVFRGSIFFGLAARSGLEAAGESFAVETLVRVVTVGLWGAVLQELRHAQPQRQATAICMLLAPVLIHAASWLSHSAAGTAGSSIAGLISIAVSALGAAFSLFMMRREVLVTGAEGGPFLRDLAALPGLIWCFLLSPLRWLLATWQR